MARGGSEDQLRIESRRSKIAAMLVRGISNQYEIAQRLGLDPVSGQRTVSNDLAAIKKEWKASTLRDFDEAKGQELAKFDALEKEYWEAWERSKTECLSIRKGKRTRPADGDTPASTEEYDEEKKQMRDGDPRFLDGIASCIEKRCKILGLIITKVAPTTPDGKGEYHFETDAQRIAALAALLGSAGAALSGPQAGTGPDLDAPGDPSGSLLG